MRTGRTASPCLKFNPPLANNRGWLLAPLNVFTQEAEEPLRICVRQSSGAAATLGQSSEVKPARANPT
jgi:hypothetical protein